MDGEADRNAKCCELVHSVVRSCGVVRLKVTGSSMLPAVWPGDEMTVAYCEFSELRTGQIVLYRRGAGLTAHRIKQIAGNRVLTRGDSLLSSDPLVHPEQIIGRVVKIIRNSRSIAPEPSALGRIIARVLGHSHLLRRIVLRLARHMRTYRDPIQSQSAITQTL